VPVYDHAVTRLPITRALASALALFCLSATLAVAQPPSAPPAASETGPEAEVARVTAPVVLDGETLFRVRGTSTYPAEERARLIAGRIEEVARTSIIAPDAVQAVPADDVVNLTAGDRFLLMVTDADARLETIDRRLLARAYVDRIQHGVSATRRPGGRSRRCS
jgi:hypothetical protein